MKYKKVYTLLWFLFILALICWDVFFFSVSSDIRIIGILAAYIYYYWRFKLKSRVTFLFSLVLFGLTYIQYILTDPALYHVPTVPSAERFAVWLYLFLGIGVIQKWKE